MEQKKTLALFDFDKTITDRDSFLPFMLFAFGYFRIICLIVLFFPHALLCFAGFMSRKKFKENFFKLTIKGWTKEKFRDVALRFYQQKMRNWVKKSAADEIKKHLENGADVSLVSASPEDWLWPFTEEYGINLIATRLEVKDGVYTGNIVGGNCRKAEKVNRIKEVYNIENYSDIYAYGDSRGDKEMLEMSNHPHFRTFD
ncbi:HAD-IB family hydrolase [bacterium]|nr:HAD-IB family hydrolase [bacterium]